MHSARALDLSNDEEKRMSYTVTMSLSIGERDATRSPTRMILGTASFAPATTCRTASYVYIARRDRKREGSATKVRVRDTNVPVASASRERVRERARAPRHEVSRQRGRARAGGGVSAVTRRSFTSVPVNGTPFSISLFSILSGPRRPHGVFRAVAF